MKIFIVISLLLSQMAWAQLAVTANVLCRTASICQNNLAKDGRTQVGVLPVQYNCNSNLRNIEKEVYLLWGSNGNLKCINGTCTVLVDYFKINRIQPGSYSVVGEIYKDSIGLAAKFCEDNVSVSDGTMLELDGGWVNVVD